ncbi:MAG: ring-cleaving dioxygenase [Thermoanaerobaculia bacterium]|nr:ring-cleaving dioxygenase [Thermoanaerobaculia bacterium]
MSSTTRPSVRGLHHVTAIAGDPQENLDFYTRVLGLRLVKKSINQDAPNVYHLFFADGEGTPGTDITFFPWPKQPKAKPGVGQIVEVPLAISAGSLDWWQTRFEELGVAQHAVEERFGERTLPFDDPHGLRLSLVEISQDRAFVPWQRSPVPQEHQILGLHSIRMWQTELDATDLLLTQVMGFEYVEEESVWHRFAAAGHEDGGGSGSYVDIRIVPSGIEGNGGVGGVHHAAWRVRDEAEELAVREAIARVGLQPTPVIDRFWFQSVYFREPGGVLFELATDGPGFGRDEDMDQLGQILVLPPWLEGRREEIEARLPHLGPPVQRR